jgi:hypothetical protein
MQKKQSQKGAWLQKIFIGTLVFIVVLLPFHAFISTWGGTEIGPLLVWKSWKEILLAAIIPLVVWYCFIRRDIAAVIWRSWLTTFVLAYTLLNFAFAIGSQASSEAVLAGMLMNLRFLAIFILAQVVWAGDHPWVHRIKQWVPTWLFVTTIIISLLAIAQITVLPRDFLAQFGYGPDTIPAYLMVDENPDALRAFATMRGPNPLGAWLLLPIALAAITVFRQRRNVLAGVALGLGVCALVASGSRSAWLGAAAAIMTLALILIPRDTLVKIVKFGAIPAIVLGAGFLWLATTVPSLRLAVFRSSPSDPHLLEGSTEQHWRETSRAWGEAVAHPFGQGVGVAGPASYYNTSGPNIAENYFVQIAQEIGFAGLLLFVAISVMVAYRLWQRRHSAIQAALLASFIGINVINIFLHGWSDDPTAMTWWALLGLYLFADNKKR